MVAYFTTIDYSIFGILLSGSLAIGIYFGFFSDDVKTAEGYLVGGHNMKPFPIAISLVASLISAISIIAYPAEVYSFGWQMALLLPTLIIITLGAIYLFLPVFYHNNLDNCYTYLELRFGKSIRQLITGIFILMHFFFLPIINYIPSLAFAEVANVNIHVVNIVISYICVVYTMLGGIKSVVWTDVLQASIMFGSVVLVAVLGIIKVGGLGEVWSRAVDGHRIFPPDLSFDLTSRTTFWNTVSSSFLIWTCYITFNQSCVQRLVSLPSLGDAKKSMQIFLVGIIFIMTFNIGTGIIVYSYYYDCDPVKAGIISKYDKLMPRFVQDVAGHIIGMPGVFISCVFSASLSSASASLHSFSGVVYNDYIRPRKWFAHTDSNANLIMRIILLFFGTYCAFGCFIVEHFSSIFALITTVAGITTGATFGTFSLGILYPWANHQGVLSGATISMIILTFITVNTQYQTSLGNLHYDIIPTSIQGCDNDTISHITAINATTTQLNNDFAFYKIAFQWYPALGVLSMWIPAMIISYLTGGQNFDHFNVELLAPCVQGWVPRKYRHTEMKLMNKKDDYNDKQQTANHSNTFE